MMASKVLSRFLPGADNIFEVERQCSDDTSGQRMLEDGRGRVVDNDRFHMHDFGDEADLDNMLVEESTIPQPDEIELTNSSKQDTTPRKSQPRVYTKPLAYDHDVPESLLMEGRYQDTSPSDERHTQSPHRNPQTPSQNNRKTPTIPPALSRETHPFSSKKSLPRRLHLDRKEQALWRWTNVENIDSFLLQVYEYYTDHGIWSILLARVIYSLSTAFLFSAYVFLSTCIDYSKIPHSKSTSEILIPKCMAKTTFLNNVMLWVFVFWWSWSLFRSLTDVRRLWHIHDFYHYLLEIPDSDMQTIPWEKVVEALMNLRDANPETASGLPEYVRKIAGTTQSKQRMDAHDIANRLMRQDNYFIALINKEILNLQLQLPFIGTHSFYSKSLEWCLTFCFDNFIFNAHGHVQAHILDTRLRLRMIETLRRRFRFAAVISIIMAPLNISAQCIYFFSRYYAEFRHSPSEIGARAFTPYAEWKMRDFNELEHDFRRMNLAHPHADQYLAQFPRDKSIQISRFISLISGTVAAVLSVATLLDPELFLGFEITSGRTAFFYLTVSMAIFAFANSSVPKDSEVHEPVLQLFHVIQYTHYSPRRWTNNFHTPAVRAEFSSLYQLKVVIFLEEIVSLVAAPFILWRNSGKASASIIDFFRQNTVHVDGIGPLCNYAVFDFHKRTKIEDEDTRGDLYDMTREYFGATGRDESQSRGLNILSGTAEDDKMAQSQFHFMERLGKYHRNQADRKLQLQLRSTGLGKVFDTNNQSRSSNIIPRRTSKRINKHAPLSSAQVDHTEPPNPKIIRSPSPIFEGSFLLDEHHDPTSILSVIRQRAIQKPQGNENVLSSPPLRRPSTSPLAVIEAARRNDDRQSVKETMRRASNQSDDDDNNDFHDNDNDNDDDNEQEKESPPSNGVLGLLVEYSKAHGKNFRPT